MSLASSLSFGGAGPPRDTPHEQPPWRSDQRAWNARRCAGGLAWRPIELVAMVLGFMVFWPVGLAILGWKMCGRHWRGREFANMAAAGWRRAQGRHDPEERSERWRPFASGNSAFDDWKSAELDRLEDERRRLDEAHREFADFMRHLRQARDREEFERFMTQRDRPAAAPQQPNSPA